MNKKNIQLFAVFFCTAIISINIFTGEHEESLPTQEPKPTDQEIFEKEIEENIRKAKELEHRKTPFIRHETSTPAMSRESTSEPQTSFHITPETSGSSRSTSAQLTQEEEGELIPWDDESETSTQKQPTPSPETKPESAPEKPESAPKVSDLPATHKPKLTPIQDFLMKQPENSLTQDQIVKIRTLDAQLAKTPQAQEKFAQNLTELMSKELDLDKDEIIQKSFEEAKKSTVKKEQSTASKLWNSAVRFWNKFGYGKTEADYVKTVVTQALNGDSESIRLMKSDEVKQNFSTLSFSHKQEILQTLQNEANTVYDQKVKDQTAALQTTGDSIAQQILLNKKFTKEAQNFTATCQELADSLKPMCTPSQRILVTFDRDNHNMIANLIDFSQFKYDYSQSAINNMERLIDEQNIQLPKYEDSLGAFRKELLKETQSFYSVKNQPKLQAALKDLGLNSESMPTQQELSKAYKKQALKWHPDRWRTSSDQEAEFASEHMKKINNANDLLKAALGLSN